MNPRFMLDADICIYAMSGRHPAVLSRFDRLRPGEAVISVIVHGELLFGASKSRAPADAHAYLTTLISVASIVSLPATAAQYYGEIRRDLEGQGKPIGGNDLWIAAHAKALDLVLVTNNEREFKRVPDLKVQNWAG